ncbi:hypothetical protein GQ53DRAFT_809730 [Thozetella sp. PMI_491]|nr:hypothetical protein GQ53DRAFT_809730 [Thozetella sp. PMI_491]
MYAATILAVAAAASVASAKPVFNRQSNSTAEPFPITIGQLGYPHGHEILAWNPTKTTLGDACDAYTKTTVLQAVNSGFYSNPLCGHPFSLDGQDGLTLLCSDGTSETASQVTAVATNGQQTHECAELPHKIYPYNCGGGSSVSQLFACQ